MLELCFEMKDNLQIGTGIQKNLKFCGCEYNFWLYLLRNFCFTNKN